MRLTLALFLVTILTIPSVGHCITLAEAITTSLQNNPLAASRRDAIAAAQATRGPIWQRFIPQMSTSINDVTNKVNVLDQSTSTHSFALGASTSMSLSPSRIFDWKVADVTLDIARVQNELTENQLALQVASVYTNLVLGQEQIDILQKTFLKILLTVQKDPKVIDNQQLLDGVDNLVFTFRSLLISRRAAQNIAVQTFESIVGVPPTNLMNDSQLEDALPRFKTEAVARQIALQNSPSLSLADKSIELRKNVMRSLLPSYFQPQLAYAPNSTAVSLQGADPIISKASTFSAGLSINLDIFGYSRGHSAAKLNVQQAAHERQNAQRSLLLQISSDFIDFTRQLETACVLKPQSLKNLGNLKSLITDIESGKDYNPTLVLTTIPQALSTITQLYAAEASLISTIADLHAQLGDLNQPSTWDLSQNDPLQAACATFATE